MRRQPQISWRQQRRWLKRSPALLFVASSVIALSVMASGARAAPSEEQQGATILSAVQSGQRSCQKLGRTQFELIGEYAMGAMLGSTYAHQAMNSQMRSVIGSNGEAQAHIFMGQRLAGCARGPAPAAYGTMMGMMGNYAAAGGMMGGFGSSRGANSSNGGMMGNYASVHHDGWSTTGIVLALLGGFALFGLGFAYALARVRRR